MKQLFPQRNLPASWQGVATEEVTRVFAEVVANVTREFPATAFFPSHVLGVMINWMMFLTVDIHTPPKEAFDRILSEQGTLSIGYVTFLTLSDRIDILDNEEFDPEEQQL